MRMPGFTAEASVYQPIQRYAVQAQALPDATTIAPQQIPAPLPGCYFVGTQCRGFYQTCHYCCGGGGGGYSRPCGWCIGWYDAPPCRPRSPFPF